MTDKREIRLVDEMDDGEPWQLAWARAYRADVRVISRVLEAIEDHERRFGGKHPRVVELRQVEGGLKKDRDDAMNEARMWQAAAADMQTAM